MDVVPASWHISTLEAMDLKCAAYVDRTRVLMASSVQVGHAPNARPMTIGASKIQVPITIEAHYNSSFLRCAPSQNMRVPLRS